MIALLGAGGVLAGCASMPDTGDIRPVKASPGADSEVQVYAVKPRKGAAADEIVNGFLEAMTSDDANFAIARTYLTPEASQKWRPDASTTVLETAPTAGRAAVGGVSTGPATSSRASRSPWSTRSTPSRRARPRRKTTTGRCISRQGGIEGKGEWRIDSPPPGLLLGASDFQRNYVSINKYYFAAAPGGAGRPSCRTRSSSGSGWIR